ncbi:hypothetical protein NECAME_01139 [Necator americanus]|uniref:Uncharacterized protein n=1 Tax=Necator americanus TaxID=51031 RepID=W2SHA4_NECAM|nr:hypothetical protein NECAME_01139 [Necator americanus]ETN69029.1 hypothetical protein NECAME_01139 [Necator americanus]
MIQIVLCLDIREYLNLSFFFLVKLIIRLRQISRKVSLVYPTFRNGMHFFEMKIPIFLLHSLLMVIKVKFLPISTTVSLMCLLRHVLICSAVFNLLTFLTGLFLGILREDLLIVSLVLTVAGLLGMLLFAITWFIRPKVIHRPIYFVKHWKEEKFSKEATINPDTTEAVMKNIRGIPFLIQAIQYSMEATYYRDILSEMGEGVVRTSVIHTAPACTSILDSESEDETKAVPFTPSYLQFLVFFNFLISKNQKDGCFVRNSAEEQWLPFGESWRNEQLRLSLERGSSNLLKQGLVSRYSFPRTSKSFQVFPYCEASPHGDRGHEAVEHDFSRIESIKRPHGGRNKSQNRQQFQVRCIGMSASFIERFNNSFRNSSFNN